MKSYELTYILSSAITSEVADTIKKDTEDFVQNKGGLVLKSQKTVPQVLAYPIKKNSSGYFLTLEFQAEENAIKEINEKLVKDGKALRHFLVVKKPIKQMKERRIRKPLLAGTKPTNTSYVESIINKDKAKDVKVELKDIEKKLDEILSE